MPAAALAPGPYAPRAPSGSPPGMGLARGRRARAPTIGPRVKLRGGRLPVAVTCALACRARIAAAAPGGERGRYMRRSVAPGTRTVRVRLPRALRRAARTRAVRVVLTARIRQDGETHTLRARTRAKKR